MCGICTIISKTQTSIEPIQKMVSALHHRGPDANGVKKIGDCVLGQARLSIIDLETGKQPMSYQNNRFWITFNGEIYNYRETKKELEKLGYSFLTSSDTEVILAAYEKWGVSCLDRFRGMFAFVLWDAKEETLFAARDIFGEKPLYYALKDDATLIMASEIKSIIASGLIEPDIERNSVDAYLALGYVPPDRTIYKNIQTLPPSHYMIFKDQKIQTACYWQPVSQKQSLSLSDAGDRLRELLEQAVTRQMVADVPVGAFLSGGLDSSTIVALMQMQSAKPIKTFSVGFGNMINELPYAKAVAEKYKTEHYEIDLGTPDVAAMLLKMAETYDEPFADTSNIPTFLVSQFAAKQVKVVLSGDGADELFGGYSWSYPSLVKSEKLSESTALWIMLRSLSKLIKHKNKDLSLLSSGYGLSSRWPDITTRQFMQNVHIRKVQREELWGKSRSGINTYEPGAYYYPPKEVNGADRGFYFDLKSYLPGDILVKVDRAAMANSLETRAPFLDRDLAEFALSLPVNLKVDNWKTKILMQDALSRYWPDELKGRRKQGFGAPIDTWVKQKKVTDLFNDVFSPGSRLTALLPGLHTHKPKNIYNQWILMVLGLWLEENKVSV